MVKIATQVVNVARKHAKRVQKRRSMEHYFYFGLVERKIIHNLHLAPPRHTNDASGLQHIDEISVTYTPLGITLYFCTQAAPHRYV